MSRELRQVRRYWPKARRSAQLLVDGVVVWTVYAAVRSDRLRIVIDANGTARVGGWEGVLVHAKPTLSEAMRAAGFGVRPLGEYASRLKSARTVVYRRGTYVVISTIDWPPMLTDTQRPRKGARLGRRKRQSDATPEVSPKWYAVAATYPRYELRHGAEVLTVVRYSPSDGMWTAPRTGGFHTAEGAMRWEEMRLNLPTCPVAEV